MDKEKTAPKEKKSNILKTVLMILIPLIVGILGGSVVTTTISVKSPETEKEIIVETVVKSTTTTLVQSDSDVTTLVEGDRGELVEETLPTYESIDGGQFKDKTTGVSLSEGEFKALGAIESVDTSSPLAFKDSTLGRCIIANNVYGAQCVSLARAFWLDYAGRDVSTCQTGVAKGMMSCYEQNAGDDFEVIWNKEDIIAGTWVVTDGSWTGHICMALGPVNTAGYVACLGENQNGPSCGEGIGGSATNIVNLSMKNFIGGYTPKTYIPEPEPEELPDTSHGF